jgi:HPt (histidine-containing phosphotransfer) domain-containing protein/HAMP domain-containing protein
MGSSFLISSFSIGVTLTAIIMLLIVFYLQSIPNKKISTEFLAYAIGGINFAFMSFIVLFSSLSYELSRIAYITTHFAIFGTHYFVKFSYEFINNPFKKESKLASKISLIFSFIGLFYCAVKTFLINPVFIFEGDLYYFDIAVPGIIIGIQFGWMFVVLFRKSAYYSNDNTVVSPSKVFILGLTGKDPKSDTLRGFMSIFFWCFAFLIMIILGTLGLLSWLIVGYSMSMGFLILLIWLAIFYFKHSGERIIFLVKQLGIIILSITSIIAIVGIMTIEDQRKSFNIIKQKELAQVIEYNPVTKPDELFAIAKKTKDGVEFTYKKNDYICDINNSTAEKADKHTPFFVYSDELDSETFGIVYTIEINGEKWFGVYSYKAYRAWSSAIASKVLIAIGFATLIMILLFPPIVKRTILAPLNRLVDGVKEVEGGNLDICVAIDSNDEVGFLTQTFNTMVSSTKESQIKLKNYAENLEGMVKERTMQLVEAKQESDEIFANIEEGLFLVLNDDGKFVLGSQNSKALSQIIGQHDLNKREFVDLLRHALTQKQVDDIEKFLRLMFRPNMSEEMLSGLNPLSEISILLGETTKHLKFKFVRIKNGNKIARLLGSAIDITQEVELARELEETKSKGKQQTQMLIKLLNSDTVLLQDFMTGAKSEFDAIEAIFSDTTKEPRLKIDELYIHVHTIKGNASMLDLDFIAAIAHNAEDELSNLKADETLSGAGFMELLRLVRELKEAIKQTDELIARIYSFAKGSQNSNETINQTIIKAISNLLQQSAALVSKKVKLLADEFDIGGLSEKERIIVKDTLVQLARNSVAHGVESEEDRKIKGKGETGIVAISTINDGQNFTLTLCDDGAGFDAEIILQKAVMLGIVSETKAAKLSEMDIYELVFSSGFSTAQNVSMIAGRGVGMELVRTKLREMGGDISFTTEKGKGSCFIVSLPLRGDA